MPPDYARKSSPNQATTPRQKPGKPARTRAPKTAAPARTQHGSLSMKSVVALAIVGGFIGFIVYLNGLPGSEAPAKDAAPTSQKAPTKAPALIQPDIAKPQFRFYEMLPETEVMPSTVDEYAPGPGRAQVDYLLQSGSFRNVEDAERQRAEIAFQGLRAAVQKIDLEEGNVWYRVNVGPFTSRSQMNAAVDKLVSISIQPLVRKIPKKG
jgi:cell division protein FtsN